jgi:hypothetical protein
MNEKKFKEEYNFLKKLFETNDPLGFGAMDEYDDIIFKVMKKNKGVSDIEIFAKNIVELLGEEFNVSKTSILDSCEVIADGFLNKHPLGL